MKNFTKIILCLITITLINHRTYSQATNIDFETGDANGWLIEKGENIDSYLMTTGTYSASNQYTVISSGATEINSLPISMTSPLGGNYIRLGSISGGGFANRLKQTFRVTSVLNALSVSYAIVLQDAIDHACNEQPYFYFVVKDSLGNVIGNSNSHISPNNTICSSGDPSFVTSGAFLYKSWNTNSISLKDYVSTNITIEFITASCIATFGGHPCYAYIDASLCNNSNSPNILSINTNTYNLLQSQNSISVCGTTTASILAPSGASSYSWTGTGITGLTTQSVSITQAGAYKLIFDNSTGCSNTTAVSFTVGASPTISINSSSNSVCINSPITFTATGGLLNYVWEPYSISSTGNFSQINTVYPTNTTIYSVTANDINGCPGTAQYTISIIANPTLVVSGNSTICLGNSTVLSVTGANSYLWSNGETTPAIFITPTISETYTVTGTNQNICTSTETVSITVDNTCQDVWPGDANSDGIADNLDVLELGLHYTQTGAPRASISNTWQSYFSNNWTGTITNGKNLNHSDCNGDGTINDNDTLAIFNNYGLTHAFRVSDENMINPQLTIVPDQPILPKGTWGTSSIYLGDASNIINDINGVAFTVNFDNTIIEPNTVWLEYPASFINTSNQNLHFRKSDFANGKIYTATTHTINNNVSGNGLIGILHYQIKSSLTTDTVLNLGITQAVHSDVSGTIFPLTAGKSSVTILVTSVGLQETMNSNFISMVPNPTDGILTINSKTELQKIEVLSITGQVLLSEIPTNVSHTLYLDNFANGIYFVNVYQKDRIVKRDKVVLNK